MPSEKKQQRDITGIKIDYKKVLNRQQFEAVMFNGGAALVIAGAGSGKTRTLVYRVARLVEMGISPRSILLLTFTRKASQEMLARSIKLLDERCRRVSGGTFHSFANSILRRYSGELGFANGFSIMDRSDSESLIGMLRKGIRPASTRRSFPTRRTLANIFSKSVNKCLPLEEIIDRDYPHFGPDVEEIVTLFHQYGRHKRDHQFFDYDDLLIKLKTLLETRPSICKRISAGFEYIMVDEYQDTNQIQADILYLLAGYHRNIMAVGDDSQSIYSFRGASFENIMNFPEMFKDTRIIRLEENYRSSRPILELTNTILESASRKYPKRLFTRRKGGDTPVLVHATDENGQSQFVIDKIQEFLTTGTPLNEIAVLFRAGFHSFDLEIELGRHQVPFVKYGGFKFMESAHIKDVLAHLRVLINLQDRISWYRILNLVDRIGQKTAQAIYSTVSHAGSLTGGLSALTLSAAQMKSLKKFIDLYIHAINSNQTVAQMGEAVLNYYLPLLKKQYDDHPKRTKDLDQLLTIMDRYDRLGKFLEDMALEPPTAAVENNLADEAENEHRLVLSTVHSAKGLEWQVVLIIWALDGRFPSLHALDKEADLEEELRLMYVAATRAKERLFFICPGHAYDRASNRFLNRPSRFIDGMPVDYLDRHFPSMDDWTHDF